MSEGIKFFLFILMAPQIGAYCVSNPTWGAKKTASEGVVFLFLLSVKGRAPCAEGTTAETADRQRSAYEAKRN